MFSGLKARISTAIKGAFTVAAKVIGGSDGDITASLIWREDI